MVVLRGYKLPPDSVLLLSLGPSRWYRWENTGDFCVGVTLGVEGRQNLFPSPRQITFEPKSVKGRNNG